MVKIIAPALVAILGFASVTVLANTTNDAQDMGMNDGGQRPPTTPPVKTDCQPPEPCDSPVIQPAPIDPPVTPRS